MALTPLRWVAGLLAGMLMMGVVILQGGGSARPYWGGIEDDITRRANRYGHHASTAASHLRTLRLLDSIAPVIARVPDAPIRVFWDAAIPPRARAALDSLVPKAFAHVRDSGHAGIDVVFVYDTARTLRGASLGRYEGSVDYVLPRVAGDRCVVIRHVVLVDTASQRSLRGLATDAQAERLAGPCAFYRAFGMPGPGVERWLRDRGWLFAGRGSWTAPDRQLNLGDEELAPYLRGVPVAFGAHDAHSLDFLGEMSIHGVQCTQGDLAACDRAILTEDWVAPLFLNGNVFLGARSYWSARSNFAEVGIGRRQPRFLAGMVRSLGRERFAKFWTSGDSVPAAFQQAAGEPLNVWTARWMQEQYGTVAPGGSHVNRWAGTTGVILIILGALIAMRVAERRQFA